MIIKTILFGALGLCFGLFLYVLSIGMTGMGHGGWYSALIGAIGVVTAPTAAVAWPLRGTRVGLVLAVAVLLVGLAADVWVVVATQKEGVQHMTQMGDAAILWCALFAAWQIVAGVAILKRNGHIAAANPAPPAAG